MLPGGYSSVMQARDRNEFRSEVVRFTQRLGFDLVSAITVIDHGLGKSEFIKVDNTPDNYVEPYVDPSCYRRDPVMQHCKRQTVDRKSTRLNSSHSTLSRMPSSA